MLDPLLDGRFAVYGESHRTLGNRICHAVGWPLIGAGAAGLLARQEIGAFDAGWLLLAAFELSWLLVEPVLAIGIAPVMLLAHWVGASLPVPADLGLLLAGNAIPIAGHLLIEKNSPANLREGLVGIWVGPIFSLRSFFADR